MRQNGRQAGGPHKAAQLYIEVAEMDSPYVSLPMGMDSRDGISGTCAGTVELMEKRCLLAARTDF